AVALARRDRDARSRMSAPVQLGSRLDPNRRKNVVRVLDAWYVACTSAELGEQPLARMVLGVPLVLFRGPAASALLDRCPHRNVPLSLGSVDHGELKCRYHGWRFNAGGA